MPYLTLMTTVNYFEQSANLPATIEVFCKFAFRLTFAFIVLKALTFSLMTLDRQDRVFRPFSPRITQSKVKKIIPLTWGLSLLTAVVIAILIRNDEQSACVKYYPYNSVTLSHANALNVVLFVIGQVENITVLIITVSYIRIRKKLLQPTLQVQGTSAMKSKSPSSCSVFVSCFCCSNCQLPCACL